MRVLLSAVGTRGDAQPVIALALEVRRLGHHVHLALPPNFVDRARSLGFDATPVGIEMRAPRPGAPPPVIPDLVADQFATVGAAAAASRCDVILGANAHQYAAPSIAERRGVPYVNALYAPTALPNDINTRAFNDRALGRINTSRARLGLAPIDDVLRHIVTARPWLACDPTLGPLDDESMATHTGAWLLADSSPLQPELERFLDAGAPPVYFGFGSMPAAPATSRTVVDAARAAGRRAVVSRGWAELDAIDAAPDCMMIGDVNQHALFPRVATAVHHGGAGTTHTAALAGVPQVAVPMFGDQPYWASRLAALGVGASVPVAELTVDRLAAALEAVGDGRVVERARTLAGAIATDGAAVAARRLVAIGGRSWRGA